MFGYNSVFESHGTWVALSFLQAPISVGATSEEGATDTLETGVSMVLLLDRHKDC